MVLMGLASLVIVPVTAHAAPVGDPVAHPDAGRLRVDARIGSETISERDTRCTVSDGCTALWKRTEIVVGVNLAILRGLGIYGELGKETGSIRAAEYQGRSRTWAVGLRGAIPIAPSWWIAADGRFGFGDGVGLTNSAASDPEVERFRIHTASLLGVWGDPSKGADVWLGAQSAWYYEHSVWPLGQDKDDVVLELPMQPEIPVSGVLGGAFYSDPLGVPWRRTLRMNVGLEARIGQVYGLSGWVGASL
jgi:hypothetical protein